MDDLLLLQEAMRSRLEEGWDVRREASVLVWIHREREKGWNDDEIRVMFDALLDR